jgi:MFS family permease
MLSRETRILLYSSNAWSLAEGMIGPFFGVLTQRIGGDLLDISWVWAIYLIVTGVCNILVGKISDQKMDKETLMITGYVLNTLFTFCYVFVSSPAQLFLVQAGLGVATALATPTWDALYSKYEDRARSGYIWGLAGGRDQLVTGIATLIGGLILLHFSFTTLFLMMGTIQAFATVFQAQILRKTHSQ